MDHLPIFCQLRDRDCLIVGGGDVAERKARLLLDAGARLTVNALAFIPQFTAWADAGMLTLVEGPFDESLLDTCWLAIAATDDDALNQRVSEAAEARRIFCNVVDAPKAASFIMPSIIDRSPLMVAVSSGGTSPVLARLLREKLESLLPLHLGQVAKYAGQLRGRVKQQFATMGERRRFWEKLFVNDRLAQSLANNDQKAITETTEQLINEPLDHRGEVVLVGAGPGDAGLLTLKGLQQIQQADVVVYDRLVSDDIMNLVRRDADRVFVGKRAGYHCVPQEEINQILLREAQKGKRVVRLKGGDPFIFGRGGEELETLCNAGIPFSVVPGITAACSGAAVLGAPLISDFTLISLSDLLTPWEKIEKRLDLASQADFVICLYNPSSFKRHDYLQKACDIMLKNQRADVPAGIVRNIGREGEEYEIMTLAELRDAQVDMFSTVIIGNSQTEVINNKMVTPRGYKI